MAAIRREQAEFEIPSQEPQRAAPVGGQAIARILGAAGPAWVVEPYGGTEPGAAAGPDASGWLAYGRGSPRSSAVHVLVDHLRGVAGRQDRSFAAHPVLLGTRSDPWQPAERDQRLTRELLGALAALPGVDLRCRTKSSLVGRDVDLLGAIARQGRVEVAVDLCTFERRVWTLLEPEAPSPERRLMAVGLLARAGLDVGVEVGPVLRGITDADATWEPLLIRARDAGARFARARPLQLTEAERERLAAFCVEHAPERAGAVRRLLSRAHLHDDRSWTEAQARFEALCGRVGLACGAPEAAPVRVPQAGQPRQLSLF